MNEFNAKLHRAITDATNIIETKTMRPLITTSPTHDNQSNNSQPNTTSQTTISLITTTPSVIETPIQFGTVNVPPRKADIVVTTHVPKVKLRIYQSWC